MVSTIAMGGRGMASAVEIGARLRARRGELGWSMRRTAALIGVGHVQLGKFETGVNRISADQLSVLCQAMGISADEILGLGPAGEEIVAADAAARKLMAIFRELPRQERKVLMKAARHLADDAPAAA